MANTTTAALVLHGAKDLRLVSKLNPTKNKTQTLTQTRNNAPFPPHHQKKSKSPSAQLESAAQTFTTTVTAAMATLSSGPQCVWATNQPAQ